MKKHLLIITLLFISLMGIAQENVVEIDITEDMYGHCYYARAISDADTSCVVYTYEKPFIIEAVEPIYEKTVKTISKEEFKLYEPKNDYEIIRKAKLIKKHVTSKPKNLKPNQKYFEGGKWSKISEVVYCTGRDYYKEVADKLKNLGYNITENWSKNDLKRELLRFQKDNNIKEKGLNLQTLIALGFK